MDLDGDGDTDLIVTSYVQRAGRVTWYENLGGFGPEFRPRIITEAIRDPGCVVAGDFDGDGDSDIVVGYYIPRAQAGPAWIENLVILPHDRGGAPERNPQE